MTGNTKPIYIFCLIALTSLFMTCTDQTKQDFGNFSNLDAQNMRELDDSVELCVALFLIEDETEVVMNTGGNKVVKSGEYLYISYPDATEEQQELMRNASQCHPNKTMLVYHYAPTGRDGTPYFAHLCLECNETGKSCCILRGKACMFGACVTATMLHATLAKTLVNATTNLKAGIEHNCTELIMLQHEYMNKNNIESLTCDSVPNAPETKREKRELEERVHDLVIKLEDQAQVDGQTQKRKKRARDYTQLNQLLMRRAREDNARNRRAREQNARNRRAREQNALTV